MLEARLFTWRAIGSGRQPPDYTRKPWRWLNVLPAGCANRSPPPVPRDSWWACRAASLYFVANSLNYLVAGTGNRSELAIGYFTKYGDGGVDLLPLGKLVKSQVWAMARELGVPTAIIDRKPTAGLWLGQTDEAEMGFGYGDLELYLSGRPQATPPAL